MFASNATSTFGHFLFQTKQRKEDLLELYGEIASPWEITESEEEQEVEEKKESEDQEFTYQNLILKNLEIETPNFQTQPNLDNSENDTPNFKPHQIRTIQTPNQPIQPLNQQNQQLPPVLPQQQQQLLLSQQQQMAYAPIVKLDKFNNDARAMQVIPFFLQNTANAWYQSFVVKPQNFNGFKTEFLWYFSNNNSINKLANIFTTIRQEDTEAILNQFIRGLCSSILQQVCPMHPVDLPTTVTYTRDFEAAELEANHTQAVNLAMNESSELDSELKQFSNSINQKLEGYLADNRTIYQPLNGVTIRKTRIVSKISHIYCHYPISRGSQKHTSVTTVVNKDTSEPTVILIAIHNWEINIEILITDQYQLTYLPMMHQPIYQLPVYQTPVQPQVIYQLQPPAIYQTPTIQTPPANPAQITSGNPRSRITQNWKSAIVVYQLIPSSFYQQSEFHQWNLGTDPTQNPNFQHYLSLLMTPEDATSSNQGIEQQQQPPTNNIPSATITENESLDEPSDTLLFNGAVLEEKLITAMYTNAKIDGHFIKLILDSVSGLSPRMEPPKPIGEINNFSIEVNGIIVPIKVLVMEATQYQALVVLAMCGHFKATNTTAPLIDFEEKKPKPTWEVYQVLWADEEHNKLLPILS
ncbi:hypothetical protein G9A89_022422 [Geosiphon pyriformis]|nr:hypothetical protein G9A89_022422 [Geosiphon pyriformis]